MSDFTSEFWSWYIIAIAGGGIVWLVYLLRATGKTDAEEDQGVPTGHVWDENLEELNNLLPLVAGDVLSHHRVRCCVSDSVSGHGNL